MTIDILPTVAALTGSKLPDHKIDGRNIWPLLSATDGAKNPHEATTSTTTTMNYRP